MACIGACQGDMPLRVTEWQKGKQGVYMGTEPIITLRKSQHKC